MKIVKMRVGKVLDLTTNELLMRISSWLSDSKIKN